MAKQLKTVGIWTQQPSGDYTEPSCRIYLARRADRYFDVLRFVEGDGNPVEKLNAARLRLQPAIELAERELAGAEAEKAERAAYGNAAAHVAPEPMPEGGDPFGPTGSSPAVTTPPAPTATAPESTPPTSPPAEPSESGLYPGEYDSPEEAFREGETPPGVVVVRKPYPLEDVDGKLVGFHGPEGIRYLDDYPADDLSHSPHISQSNAVPVPSAEQRTKMAPAKPRDKARKGAGSPQAASEGPEAGEAPSGDAGPRTGDPGGPPDDARLEWRRDAETEDWSASTVTTWTTACGRYRVLRIESKLAGGHAPEFLAAYRAANGDYMQCYNVRDAGNYPHRRKTLNAALEDAERYHRERTERRSVASNLDDVLAEAVRDGLADGHGKVTSGDGPRDRIAGTAAPRREEPGEDSPMTEARDMAGTIKISEKAARDMLTGMGFAAASKWKAAVVEKRLNVYERLVEEYDALGDGKKDLAGADLETFKQVTAAHAEGKKVTLAAAGKARAASTKPSANGHGKAAHKAGKGKAAGKADRSNPKAPREAGGGVDAFGSRIGSCCAKANAVLSSKPKTMAEIMKEAGISYGCYNHLNELTEKGVLVRTEEGYALAKKGK